MECEPRKRHETLHRQSRRNIAGEFSGRRECAGRLRGGTRRTGTHGLLPWPKSVLSWTIRSCRCQSARAIRRRVVSGNYRNRPSETRTTSATIKALTIPARGTGKTSIMRPLLSTSCCPRGREKFRFGTHYRGRGPAPPLGYATWFGQCHMFVGTLAMRTIVPRTAPAVLWREVNLRQGSQMASQLELSARAGLCRELAKREPTNRVLWTAEAENWSRLSNQKLRGEPEQKSAAHKFILRQLTGLQPIARL
jgi:hypothetical protein